MEKSEFALSKDSIVGGGSSKKKVGIFPVRYMVTVLFFVGCTVMYPIRVGLNIAIVAMLNSSMYATNTSSSSLESLEENGCPVEDTASNTTVIRKDGPFIWTPSEQGVILGAFYYGYMITNVLGGRLSEKFGSKITFGGGIGVGAVLTLITPLVAEWHIAPLIIVRILIGAFQGFSFPAIFVAFPAWFPPNEVSSHLAIALSGNQVGVVVGMYLGGYLCENGFAGGWPSVFYVFGAVGCVFTVVFWFLMHTSPEEHPRISAEELQLITGHRKYAENDEKPPVPWRKIVTSIPVWSLVLTQIMSIYAMHIVLTRIQAYLDGVLHFPVEKNGQINAIMFFGKGAVAISSGFFSKFILRKYVISRNLVRKVFESIALVGIGVTLAVIPLLGCDSLLVSIVLVISMTVSGLDCGGVVPAITEVAPRFSGTIFGIGNTFVAITGFVAPMVVGLILEENPNSVEQWSYVFYSSSAVCFIGAFIFGVFGSSNVQPWAETETDKSTATVESDVDKDNVQRY